VVAPHLLGEVGWESVWHDRGRITGVSS